MPRISFRQLEEARTDPKAFSSKLSQSGSSGFGPSYFGSLRDAIFRYHNHGNDSATAIAYLEKRLGRFKNAVRIQETIANLIWYIDDHSQSGLVTFQSRINIKYPLAPLDGSELRISGQIGRLDLSPVGGYLAWVFRSKDHSNWESDIQMPLLQHTLSTVVLSCPIDEITMGLLSFEERFTGTRSYQRTEVENATRELIELLTLMGFKHLT